MSVTPQQIAELIEDKGIKTNNLFSDTYLDIPKDQNAQWYDLVRVVILTHPLMVQDPINGGYMLLVTEKIADQMDEDFWRAVFNLMREHEVQITTKKDSVVRGFAAFWRYVVRQRLG